MVEKTEFTRSKGVFEIINNAAGTENRLVQRSHYRHKVESVIYRKSKSVIINLTPGDFCAITT